MTSDLVKGAEERGLQRVEELVGVSGQVDQSDFVLPYMKIVQPTTPEGTKGNFIFDSGVEKPEVNFVVLHIALTRTLMVTGEGLVCSSRDRVMGFPRKPQLVADGAEEGQPFKCAVCPHMMDSPFEKEGCKLDYDLTLYDVDDSEAFMFRVRGMATKEFRAKVLNAPLTGRKPPWFAQFNMVTDKQQNAKGTYYTPVIRPTLLAGDNQAEWAAFAAGFSAPAQQAEIDPDDLPFE
ncbi:MAG TPA: hypothetical protein VF981_16055 [Gemmatimonadaceae bacterium]